MPDYYDRPDVAELEGDLLKAVRAGNADRVLRLYHRLLAARAVLATAENATAVGYFADSIDNRP
jgi:hypothetical protein